MENFAEQDLLQMEELEIRYGTFWPRFLAILIDSLVLAVLAPLSYYNRLEWKSVLLLSAISFVQIVYRPFFEYMYGATPGKMALGLKVVNDEFQRASATAIMLRNIFNIVAGLVVFGLSFSFLNYSTFTQTGGIDQYSLNSQLAVSSFFYIGIGIITIIDAGFLLTSPQSKSLHDLIGKTFVIKK